MEILKRKFFLAKIYTAHARGLFSYLCPPVQSHGNKQSHQPWFALQEEPRTRGRNPHARTSRDAGVQRILVMKSRIIILYTLLIVSCKYNSALGDNLFLFNLRLWILFPRGSRQYETGDWIPFGAVVWSQVWRLEMIERQSRHKGINCHATVKLCFSAIYLHDHRSVYIIVILYEENSDCVCTPYVIS